MERRKLFLILFIISASISLFLSCGKSESGKQSKVVGNWYRIDNKDKVELFIDKTFRFDKGNNGNWILLPDGRFKFTSRDGEVFMGWLDEEALILMINNKKGEVFFKHPAPPPAQNVSKLTGKWENNDGFIFDFTQDGMINVTDKQGGSGKVIYVIHGKYIKFITQAAAPADAPDTAKIEIGDKDFWLFYIGSQPDIFRKVN